MRFADLQTLRVCAHWRRWAALSGVWLPWFLVGVAWLGGSALIAAGLTFLLWPEPAPVEPRPPLATAEADAPHLPRAGFPAATTPAPTEVAAPQYAVPAATLAQPSFTPPPCVAPSDWNPYVVQPGNTLYSIARRYGTDVSTLQRVNCLDTTTIFVNQRLWVPGAPEEQAAAPTVGLSATTPAMVGGALPTPDGLAQPVPTPPPVLQVDLPSNLTNIVLLGSDQRAGSQVWRTDSMIVVAVDSQARSVRLLSIPRDLWVYIPTHGYDRINTADTWGSLAQVPGGGPALVKQTIYHNLGIPIHYYVRVDFDGFVDIIDAVGGIDVNVDCPVPDIGLSAGVQHMDGAEALRYVRSRRGTSDFDRGRRQRQVLLALWEQALRLDIIPKLPRLWIALSGTFGTDLGLGQILDLAYLGVQLTPPQIKTAAIGTDHVQGWTTPAGAQVLLPRQEPLTALLEQFFAPTAEGSGNWAEGATVEIVHGSERRADAELAASQLRWEGFRIVSTALAGPQETTQTDIIVFHGDAGAGESVARALGVPVEKVQLEPDADAVADVRVILGGDYDACRR